MKKKILNYIKVWESRCYKTGLPDEVPNVLMKLKLAPSYKAIVLAILSNDHSLKSLGVPCKKSEWYSYFKKIELEERAKREEGGL